MTLRYVALVLDATDATGASITSGSASVTPNAVLAAPADTEWIPQAPVTVPFPTWGGAPAEKLLATDNADVSPSGWAYTITFNGVSGNPASFSFYLPAGPLNFTATNATPCVFTVTGTAPVNNAAVTLAGASLPAGFTAGTTYFVVSQSGATFELSATLAGTPIGSTSTGTGAVTTTSLHLSAVTQVSPAPSVLAYLPLPSGTATAGYIPVATGTGEASAWQAQNVTSVFGRTGAVAAQAGDYTATQVGALPVPSGTAAAGQVPVATGTAEASSWAAVSGAYLAAPHVYAPGVLASPSVSSATLAAFDTTNLTTGTFTAPPSGSVVVTMEFTASPPSTQIYGFALAAHGTVTPVAGNVITAEASSLNVQPVTTLKFVVTSLTPGTSYAFDLLGAAASGSLVIHCIGSTSVTPTGQVAAPFISIVQAV